MLERVIRPRTRRLTRSARRRDTRVIDSATGAALHRALPRAMEALSSVLELRGRLHLQRLPRSLPAATGDTASASSSHREVSARVAAGRRYARLRSRRIQHRQRERRQIAIPIARRTRASSASAVAIERQDAQLERHPRTHSGNFWHKKIYPHQVWLDGLYMAQPFRCAYAKLTQARRIFDGRAAAVQSRARSDAGRDHRASTTTAGTRAAANAGAIRPPAARRVSGAARWAGS